MVLDSTRSEAHDEIGRSVRQIRSTDYGAHVMARGERGASPLAFRPCPQIHFARQNTERACAAYRAGSLSTRTEAHSHSLRNDRVNRQFRREHRSQYRIAGLSATGVGCRR